MKFTVYTSDPCSYCKQAKMLLESRGVAFEEIRLDTDKDLMLKIMQDTGHRTVPIIFAEDIFIGGYDELRQLDTRISLDQIKKEDLT